MVRASGTENLLRIYSETNSPASTKQVLQAIVSTIQQL
jgi:phosphomannomutase